ncbi:TipC family immunity protein [uncultured Streptococcus sp.]|uniref:TipC family immunity protein n=1 Tax=uncultured Streptococcus sp. TaxID=83427 RepID=UPI002674F819|nr:TipC family immunity protein [uncultured Streptococcus sp.]
MKKHRKTLLWLSPLLLLALYWLGIYLSLKNPMEEIVYSENGGIMRNMIVKSYTQTIGSEAPWKEDEGFQTFPYSDKIVGGKEHLAVTMFRGTADWFYMYKYKLNESTSVNLIFEYDASKKIFYQSDLYLTINETSYEGQQLLDQLATYGKDRTWLKKQSKKVAEQYILGTWFKNGSSRYSLKNLGDMKIEYDKLIEE